MGFGKLIFSYLLKIRDFFQKMAGNAFSRSRDPETGKFKYISPDMAKKLLYAFAGAFFFIVLISQLITRDKFMNRSFDDYQKEVRSDGGTRMRETGGRALFDRDPLVGGVTRGGSDPLADVVNGGNDFSTSGIGSFDEGDSFSHSSVPTALNPAIPVPAASECFELIEKAKAGSALSSQERAKLNSCLTNNVVPVSDAEKAMLRALAASDLSPAERQAILSTLKGDGVSDVAQKLSDVISASVDPQRQGTIKDGVNRELSPQGIELQDGEVRGLSKTLAGKPSDYEDAIGGTSKILGGDSPDNQERANLIDAIRAVKGGEGAALDNPNLNPDKERALSDLINDVQARDEKLNELRQQLAEAQAEARSAAEKLTQGLELTPEEQAALDKLSALRKEVDALAAVQEKRQRALIELTGRLEKSVVQAKLSIQKTIPSGVFEGYADYEPLDCKNVKPLVRVAKHKSSGKAAGLGKSLKAKPAYNIYRIEDEVAKSNVQPDGKRLDISKYMSQNINVGELFVMKGAAEKTLVLSPETKIAAMLDSEIMVSSSGSGQVVRIRIVQDVFDAKDRRLVIPKNSIAMGRASSFDENTGVMDFTLDKVSVGSGEVKAVSLRVGSGDGTMGLKGQVRDTRGRYLLGAFITSFTAGALDFFTQNTIASYQQSAVAATALTGSAYNGGASVMEKIANMYASDLQNAPRVFYVPRGVPIVLYPDAQ